ncbi:Phosphatidylinositol 3-/4-kinase, catalytic domain [Dillenia turbinata]|uniref:Serine/threonine-protein kinase ATM n=1 Tax=Dillenia turbinata TaxID=194707 RepID=A0AAN8V168_9MAGN
METVVSHLHVFLDNESISGLSLQILSYEVHPFEKIEKGDLGDVSRLRQNMLRAVMSLFNWQESLLLNEQLVVLLPAAIYTLCTGSSPIICSDGLLTLQFFSDASELQEDWAKLDKIEPGGPLEIFECSVELLSEINQKVSSVEDPQSQCHLGIRLPRRLRDTLLHEMESSILRAIVDTKVEKMLLSDMLYICALLSNILYYFLEMRPGDVLSFLTKMSQCLLEFLRQVVSVIEEKHADFQIQDAFCSGSLIDEGCSLLVPLRLLLSSPLFMNCTDQNGTDFVPYSAIIQSVENLLRAFAKLYEECSQYTERLQSETIMSDLSSNSPVPNSYQCTGSKSMFVDMELDVNQDIKDADLLSVNGNLADGTLFPVLKWKLDMVSLISNFFSVLPVVTWEILFDLMEKEKVPKVSERILCNLCQQFNKSSPAKLADLVNIMNKKIEVQVNLMLPCFNILEAICALVVLLLSWETSRKQRDDSLPLGARASEEDLLNLGELLNRVAEVRLLDWFGRVKLVHCICNFILVSPEVGQFMLNALLDGQILTKQKVSEISRAREDEQILNHNFGVKLIGCSKEKLVTVKEVQSAGTQPRPRMETIVITLAHLAYHSETIELELFGTRELIHAVLDNLSKRLEYATRTKYLEELLGPILFSWVACGVNLTALIEDTSDASCGPVYVPKALTLCGLTIKAGRKFLQFCRLSFSDKGRFDLVDDKKIWHRLETSAAIVPGASGCHEWQILARDLFLPDSEPSNFVQYCCHWLLPALILQTDMPNMNMLSKFAQEPLPLLVRNHFDAIFSMCMVLHCSKMSESEKGALVLQSSILQIAEMSEDERDLFIKKHMVSIVSHILSLASCSPDPALPYFSADAVVRAIQTVVDGFMEMEDYQTKVGVTDKINIFRPDRVFMLLVETHYKVTAAAHPRHKCHWLAGIEVLVNILGHRAAVSSTSNYLFNMVGQFVSYPVLQEQCCRSGPSTESTIVLGEQLQELEPFPELEIFSGIRKFHQELNLEYSSGEHLVKFVKRSCYLPPRLLHWSLQLLQNKLFSGEIIPLETNAEDNKKEDEHWHCQSDIVQAVWMLVRMCGSDDAIGFRALVADVISRVGIGDPHCVVLRLPGDGAELLVNQSNCDGSKIKSHMDSGISEELLLSLINLLKKYLMDDSVHTIDMTSQALRGVLSTERGQRALQSFSSYERSLIEIHSKGVNLDLVEKILFNLGRKFSAKEISLEKSSIWETNGKTYEMWVCQLVSSLIGYSNDVILRLCQDMVLLKDEVAELLLSSVIVNLAGRKDLTVDLRNLISLLVQGHLFNDSNKLIKSVRVLLDALNELRICYMMDRTSTPISSKREASKCGKPSSYGSRSRSSSARTKDSAAMIGVAVSPTSLWDKVYWLPIDYLVVAKSALMCGSYFTSVMYVEYWCEEHFRGLTLGKPDFSHLEMLPNHIDILISAVKQINEPDSLYGIIQSHKLTSQVITLEHEGNWSKALECYDLQIRSDAMVQTEGPGNSLSKLSQPTARNMLSASGDRTRQRMPFKGLIRSLQRIGCTHLLDTYCHGLTSKEGQFQHDSEFTELQYEAAWRAGNWDFSLLYLGSDFLTQIQHLESGHFNENLHSCLRALQEGDVYEFYTRLNDSKQELVLSLCHANKESTESVHSAIIKLQIFHHLGMAWDLRWPTYELQKVNPVKQKIYSEPVIPTMDQLLWMNMDWSHIVKQTQLHMNLLEPFIAFRGVLLRILGCKDCTIQHLLQSASTLRKGAMFSQAAAALHELKFLSAVTGEQYTASYWLGRLEEAKLLRTQGQNEMAINLAKYISENYKLNDNISDIYRLIGKWLAETRCGNSRTILDSYLKHAVLLAEDQKTTNKMSIDRQSQPHFHLAHYADALFRSYEERLNSNEWQAAMQLRKHKEEKSEYSLKILELKRQLALDVEEDKKFQNDRDNFLSLALEGYKRCLVIGEKYDVRVVFRLISLWFNLSSRPNVIDSMLGTINEVQSYKFIPLVYQIASRMGGSKDNQGPHSFQFALVSLVKKMAIDHPYHTIFQLLALANGDRIKDKQRSRNSFVVDMDKKLAAEKLLHELLKYHGAIIRQMKQMVEIYIKLAELETRREDTNKKIALPRDIRCLRQLELVPVVTSNFPVDRSCRYHEGSFPHFKGLADSVMVMNGINAPKVVECMGSDGHLYRQLAKSGNDDLRQDAVMEQFFGLVNTFLQNHRDTWKRRLGIRTYKVVPFTPSAGILEWVTGTVPLGEYLIGRPVMHFFFLERFLQPADWFEKRLAYTRSVAASSMVGYIVGLGDRHSMNILMDQATAEVVHIDLGVAFEQGLMLKTPERIPFRLTRDIIDGMGVTGVEGVFRKCCEETLSVMRTNKEALLTIVEVFIHDPLYKWALSPLKALQRQKEMDDESETSLEGSQDEFEGNKDATRALLRVKQKLDGYEGGEMRSVHGQVQQLIQDAIDPERLCQLYPGWGAWL